MSQTLASGVVETASLPVDGEHREVCAVFEGTMDGRLPNAEGGET